MGCVSFLSVRPPLPEIPPFSDRENWYRQTRNRYVDDRFPCFFASILPFFAGAPGPGVGTWFVSFFYTESVSLELEGTALLSFPRSDLGSLATAPVPPESDSGSHARSFFAKLRASLLLRGHDSETTRFASLSSASSHETKVVSPSKQFPNDPHWSGKVDVSSG